MKKLTLIVMIVGLTSGSVLAQKNDKPVPFAGTDSTSVAPPSDLPFPGLSLNKSKDSNQAPFPPEASNFVFVNGAVYMRSTINGQLLAMPGGGASGCFSIDLSQRVDAIHDFIRLLDAQKQGDLHDGSANNGIRFRTAVTQPPQFLISIR